VLGGGSRRRDPTAVFTRRPAAPRVPLEPYIGNNNIVWCMAYERSYARRMGQPTQRATNYTARSNIDTAQIFLYANGQRPKRAMIRQRSRRRQRRGEPHTEHGLGVLLKVCGGGVVYCAIVVQYYCNSVGIAGGDGAIKG